MAQIKSINVLSLLFVNFLKKPLMTLFLKYLLLLACSLLLLKWEQPIKVIEVLHGSKALSFW